MKLSVVIPHYFGLPGKSELLCRAVSSLIGHDELIVIGHASRSLPWALNAGMSAAHGEHILIFSDDMQLVSGTLDLLCHEEYVTHPLVNGKAMLYGGVMCFPRWVYEAVGPYDERFVQGVYDDDDMIRRLEKVCERRMVRGVDVFHPPHGATLGRLGWDEAGNRALFESKHGPWQPVLEPPAL